jgi:SAM-dependent methyltransferase
MNEPQVSSEHYCSPSYNSKARFASYWHQIDETLQLAPKDVLEAGVGHELVTSMLRKSGVHVTTLDLDAALQPDLVGSITDIPLPDQAVDVALACQVLEHLPWPQAERGLAELRRVARRAVIVSVPNVSPYVGFPYPLYFGMYIDRLRAVQPPTRFWWLRPLLQRRLRLRDLLWMHIVPAEWTIGGRVARPPLPIPHVPWKHEFDGEHYFELGTDGFPEERMRQAFVDAQLVLERDFRVPENPWHHFFIGRPVGAAPTPPSR